MDNRDSVGNVLVAVVVVVVAVVVVVVRGGVICIDEGVEAKVDIVGVGGGDGGGGEVVKLEAMPLDGISQGTSKVSMFCQILASSSASSPCAT